MATATLVRKKDPAQLATQATHTTRTLTEDLTDVTHNFVIKVDIDMKKTSCFLDHLNAFEFMRKAQLSARPKGVSIKLKTTNEKLSGLVLRGIHEYADVKCTHILMG